jgi:hypothetical protein
MDYPSELPLVEIQTLIAILRSQEVVTKKSRFAHALWVVQGYAQSKLLGSDANFDLVTQSATACCSGGCGSQSAPVPLQDLALEQLQKAVDSSDGLSAQAIIDWKIVLKFAVEKLLEYLLSQSF